MTTYPDDLGTNQTRTLDSANRSFESVVYQRKKPPLSCEVNLNGRLASDHAQDAFKALSPSGWTVIGSIRDTSTGAKAGDLICSSDLSANTLNLVGTGNLIAYVNGMKIQVQGTNTSTEDNLITLLAPPTSGARADFIFLEVWRKLVSPTDTVYENGNVLYGGTNPDNDLIDPAIDIETSLRIQVQYRIRSSDCDVQSFPNGFDPFRVFAQGPLAYPLSGSFYFTQVPGDPGLWRSGSGDPASQSLLGTVDGYVYAIPMFIVARRNTSTYDPTTQSNGAGRTLANYLAGMPSDRPDNKYSDYIVADDVLDFRHRISSTEGGRDLCDKAFNMLLKGDLRGKMSKSFYGEDHYGVTLLQPDGVSPDNPGWFNRIGTGDGIRRCFANAGVSQNFTLAERTISQKDEGSVGSPWASGDVISPPSGTIVSIEDVYLTKSTAPSFLKSPILITGIYGFCGPTENFISTDEGGTWTQTYPASGYYNKVTFAGDRIIGLWGSIDELHELHESTDGINWTSIHTSTPNLYDVAWNVDSIALASDSSVQVSFDNGSTWNYTATSAIINRLVWGNNQYLGVGENGDTITSPDGSAWTDHIGAAGANVRLYDALYDGTKYVAPGYNFNLGEGTILTSLNGVIWTTQTVPIFGGSINAVARNSSLIVAVGDLGYVITSPDGAAWTQQTSYTSDDLKSITWTGRSFIAVGYTSGDIISSIDGISWAQIPAATNGSTWITSSNVAIVGTSVNITTSSLRSYNLTLNYTEYVSGQNGFSQLPMEVLEFRGEAIDSSSFASINSDIRVRSSDTTDAFLSNRGGNITEYYDFGHQMLYYVKGDGLSQITFSRNLYGYNILGIASLYDGTAYRSLTNVLRSSTQYTINSSVFAVGADMTLNLYTAGKFFETSIQGRGITDSLEMAEFIPIEAATGQTTFHIDTTSKAVLKIASNQSLSGYGIAYVNGIQETLLTNNANLPADTTVSRATIEFSVAPSAGALIEVPVLMKSPIAPTEGYIAYYKTLPYQGMLTDEVQGNIESSGSAIVTSAGSGGITNEVRRDDAYVTANFVQGSTTITGNGTNWLSTAKVGYLICADSYGALGYKIIDVISDTALTVSSPVAFNATSTFTIKSIDLANFEQANIIDRLPTLYTYNDRSGISIDFQMGGYNETLTSAYPINETLVRNRIQDIVGRDPLDVHIGVNAAERGRKTVHIDGGNLGLGNLGLKFERTYEGGCVTNYKKTYQSYLLNKDSTGEIYLMVVGSETDNMSQNKFLNEKSDEDTVDIFRIPGRPINLRRIE